MKYSAVIFVLFFSIVTQASASGWYDAGKVTRVHTGHGNGTFANSTIYFSTINQFVVESCSSNAGYTFDENNPNAERIYSLLLSAYVSKLPVSIYVTGDCLSGRPKIDAVQFRDEGVQY